MAKYRTGFAVALIVLLLDQLTKWLVTGPLGINQHGDQLVLLPIFNFTYTENNGISLGLLNATTEVGSNRASAARATSLSGGPMIASSRGGERWRSSAHRRCPNDEGACATNGQLNPAVVMSASKVVPAFSASSRFRATAAREASGDSARRCSTTRRSQASR